MANFDGCVGRGGDGFWHPPLPLGDIVLVGTRATLALDQETWIGLDLGVVTTVAVSWEPGLGLGIPVNGLGVVGPAFGALRRGMDARVRLSVRMVS